MALNPNTNTREEFTLSLTQRPLLPNASSKWKERADLLRNLHSKLAMAANLQQTYMTPAANKNKVHFMWDFIGRTPGMLYSVPPDTPVNMLKTAKEAWSDVLIKSVMAANLIADTAPGMLDMMIQCPGQAGPNSEFGEEILGIARQML